MHKLVRLQETVETHVKGDSVSAATKEMSQLEWVARPQLPWSHRTDRKIFANKPEAKQWSHRNQSSSLTREDGLGSLKWFSLFFRYQLHNMSNNEDGHRSKSPRDNESTRRLIFPLKHWKCHLFPTIHSSRMDQSAKWIEPLITQVYTGYYFTFKAENNTWNTLATLVVTGTPVYWQSLE